MSDRDRYDRDLQTGIRGLVDGVRTVAKDGTVMILGRKFTSHKLRQMVGKRIRVHVADCYGLEYSGRDEENGQCVDVLKPSRFPVC